MQMFQKSQLLQSRSLRYIQHAVKICRDCHHVSAGNQLSSDFRLKSELKPSINLSSADKIFYSSNSDKKRRCVSFPFLAFLHGTMSSVQQRPRGPIHSPLLGE